MKRTFILVIMWEVGRPERQEEEFFYGNEYMFFKCLWKIIAIANEKIRIYDVVQSKSCILELHRQRFIGSLKVSRNLLTFYFSSAQIKSQTILNAPLVHPIATALWKFKSSWKWKASSTNHVRTVLLNPHHLREQKNPSLYWALLTQAQEKLLPHRTQQKCTHEVSRIACRKTCWLTHGWITEHRPKIH